MLLAKRFLTYQGLLSNGVNFTYLKITVARHENTSQKKKVEIFLEMRLINLVQLVENWYWKWSEF